MNTRLLQILNIEQLSPSKFADMLGVQRSGLSHILSGRNKPGFDFIESLLRKFPSISAEWLITGKGKMYKELDLFSNIPDNEEIIRNIDPPEPPENLINESKPTLYREKKSIKQIIIIYSDNSFSEYSVKAT